MAEQECVHKTGTFFHVPNFTGYMQTVVDIVRAGPKGLSLLDLPAGSGRMADALRALGHEVVCGDINGARPDYLHIDMSGRLPFEDARFDGVICLEGLEHVIDPAAVIGELVRVCRKGGRIIVSTPNVTNAYSRLQFLFTGTFHQFNPAVNPEVGPGEMVDRGHISPLTYQQLHCLFAHHGARVLEVRGDRSKRKILFPVYALFLGLGKLWTWKLMRATPEYRLRNREIFRHLNSRPLLFSRSQILVLEKIA